MTVLRSALVVAAAQLAVLAPSGGAHAATAVPLPGAGCAGATAAATNAATRRVAAAAVLCLVNVERSARALAPVATSPQLNRAATLHSSDMVRRKYFSHVSPNGVDLRKRVARAGYTRSRRATLGETIAWGTDMYAAPLQLVTDLMNSSAHRSIILGKAFRDIGVGLALGAPMEGMGAGGSTLSLNFGRR